MFGNVPRAMWQRWLAPDEQGRVPLACRAFLIEVGEERVLLETGIGAFFEPKLRDRFGVVEERHVLLESLAQAGVRHEDIDYVILSHLHFDHAGGLLPVYGTGDELLFPKATFIAGAEAFERAKQPHFRDRASFIPNLDKKLNDSGRLKLISRPGPLEICGGQFAVRFSSGHTPGQMHVVVTGAETTAVFCGDLIPGVPWVHLPVTMGYDRFPEQLIDEKQDLYDQAVAEDWLLLFTHDPNTSAAHVARDERGRFSAVRPHPVLERFVL